MEPLPYSKIVARAMRDMDFRDALQRDPKRALARAFGINVPDDVSVTVLADTLDTVHAVLPSRKGLHGEERGPIADMLERFRSDKRFRAAALEDPKAVFERWHDVRLPEKPNVKAVLETPEDRYVHLPHMAFAEVTTLPEAEAVYGGGGNGGGYSDLYAGTYETGGVCTCLTEYDVSSSLPTCCDGPPIIVGPEGGNGGDRG